MYIDSNIFIFAALDRSDLGDNCRKILDMIQNGDLTCASSYLTIDEVIWIIKKKLGKEKAVKIANAALSLPVRWIDVDREIIHRMIDHFGDQDLDPRDCLHLSSMRSSGINTILSEDQDFDTVKGIRRLGVGDLLKDIE
ncbi:MAG: type II toxin-antitoxin system VapC family toxin [Thermoplasmatota archaeon]